MQSKECPSEEKKKPSSRRPFMKALLSKCLVPIIEPDLQIGLERQPGVDPEYEADYNDEEQLSEEKQLWIKQWLEDSRKFSPTEVDPHHQLSAQ